MATKIVLSMILIIYLNKKYDIFEKTYISMEIKPTKSNILQSDRFNIYLETISTFLRL